MTLEENNQIMKKLHLIQNSKTQKMELTEYQNTEMNVRQCVYGLRSTFLPDEYECTCFFAGNFYKKKIDLRKIQQKNLNFNIRPK